MEPWIDIFFAVIYTGGPGKMEVHTCFWDKAREAISACMRVLHEHASGLRIGERCVPLFSVLLFTLTDVEKWNCYMPQIRTNTNCARVHMHTQAQIHTCAHVQTVKK